MNIVIVGASLAGLTAAQTLRAEGFQGRITIIGDEPYLPYDRPPLSKAVLIGRFPSSHTQLPRKGTVTNVDWHLGVGAASLDAANKRLVLANGEKFEFDRLLIATGTRARTWHDETEARLDGVFTVRGRDDAARLRARLSAGPRRVLVLGGGFTGSEIASCCRELEIPVTLVERGCAPLVGALGSVVAQFAALLQRSKGVDLRTGVTVLGLDGDSKGRFSAARLSDGSQIEADVAVVALGAIRNTEWLHGSGLLAGPLGVACDAGCRVFAENVLVTDDFFVAGDVSRFPHPLYRFQFLALEHWGNAVEQARVAAHNMTCKPSKRWAHLVVPAFWSTQFGINIKSVGVPSAADEVLIAQGAPHENRFTAVYGKQGRIVAAVSFDQGKFLDSYQRLIERSAAFPPSTGFTESPMGQKPVAAGFPDRATIGRQATAILTGYDAADRNVRWILPSSGTSEIPQRKAS